MTLDEIRAELPVLSEKAYLNAGTFGPLPRRTAEAQQAWTERALVEGRAGRAFFDQVIADRARLKEALGALIGAPPESVALTTSTSEGCNIVAAGLRLAPGDEVVTTDAEHPGLLSPLATWGADVRVAAVSQAPAADALALLEEQITERTKLVAISHVTWTTGQVLPVAGLAGRHFHLLVDGAQSAGAIPVDVAALGCDYFTVSGQKWLLGPDTTGGLYVRPDRLDDLQMASASYLSWADPIALEPAPTAQRFESIWTSAGSVAGLLASLELAGEAGEVRFAHARAMTERARELVAMRGLEVVTEPDQATLVSFVPEGPADELVVRLYEQGVVVRDLPQTGWVRASCGFWTSEDDLARLAAGL